MKTYKFIVHGRVQGVGYRRSIESKSKSEGFKGYVKNLSDGTVEAVSNLDADQKERFISLLQKGSMVSRVDKIEEEVIKPTGFTTFEVRY